MCADTALPCPKGEQEAWKLVVSLYGVVVTG